MKVPLSVRPGQKKDKASGYLSVMFSLYQKDLLLKKPVDTPAPAPAAVKPDLKTDQKAAPASVGGDEVSGAGFERLKPAKGIGKSSGLPRLPCDVVWRWKCDECDASCCGG
jgi:hypothetical protein